MIFRKFGGSYQYWVSTPEELPEVLRLDPALWAALSVPVAALNANRKFLEYLDFDANKTIRLDDVESAIKTVQRAFKDLKSFADPAPEIAISTLNDQEGECRKRLDFIASVPELVADGKLRLADVSAKLQAVASGALRGDGVLRAPAAAGSGAEALFAEVLGVSGGGEGITSAQLDKFLTDAADFLEWAKQTERPKFRDADPAPYYDSLMAVKGKVEEFFRFCELLRLDSAHEKRFRLDPDNLPPLDIKDGEAVAETLRSAPLTAPNRAAELDFNGELNPCYRDTLRDFAKLFGIEKLTPESWAALQTELSPYAEYLDRAQGDNIGRLGEAKLTACLADGQPDILHELFTRDSQVGGVLDQLRSLEKLILFKQYLWPFINNFVCFKALFSADETSMIQAGRLIMDGRTFELTLWIDNIAAHKAIAVKSHLCLIYLELVTASGAKRYVATAVTAGDLKRIYVGKPAFFIDSENRQYNGKIVDLVYGPVSFWQTVFEPFRRLGAAISSKTQKLTDYSSTEKAMNEQIDTTSNKLTAPKSKAAPQAPAAGGGGLFSKGNSTMLLLAGGLSLAALGAAISYAVKTITSIAASLSAMPPMRLIQLVLTILLILFAPLALYAILQLRKRNLTLFLEAAGWAINLPMKLNSRVSKFFTFFGIYPEDAKFKMLSLDVRNKREDRVRARRKRFWISVVVLTILLIAGLHCWKTGKLERFMNCCRNRCRSRQSSTVSPNAKPTETKKNAVKTEVKKAAEKPVEAKTNAEVPAKPKAAEPTAKPKAPETPKAAEPTAKPKAPETPKAAEPTAKPKAPETPKAAK